jgi:nucleoside-diphosphate-sugar epimerase
MRSVVITGGTGFIGSHLTSTLASRGVVVRALGSADVDLSERAETFDYFREELSDREIDYIFHLAAVYKAGGWPVEHPGTQFFLNMAINVNCLEAWKEFCPRARLVSVVSYCMYPPHEGAHPESELWGSEPEDYLFAYAFTKKALLIGQRAYSVEYGLDSTSVVLPTVYGPGDSFAEDSHVVGALIGKFVRAVRSGVGEVEVWGTGDQVREYLHVDDTVDGILTAAERSQLDVVNLGTGKGRTVREVAGVIADAAGFGGAIRFNPGRFTGVTSRTLDCSLAREALGWSASVTLEEGIRETVQWYRRKLGSD